ELGLEPLPPLRFAALAGVRREGVELGVQRIDLAKDDAGPARAAPMGELQPDGGVEHLVVIDTEGGAAEGDAEGAVGTAVEAEARVLAPLAHRADVGHPSRRD